MVILDMSLEIIKTKFAFKSSLIEAKTTYNWRKRKENVLWGHVESKTQMAIIATWMKFLSQIAMMCKFQAFAHVSNMDQTNSMNKTFHIRVLEKEPFLVGKCASTRDGFTGMITVEDSTRKFGMNPRRQKGSTDVWQQCMYIRRARTHTLAYRHT